MSVKIFSATLEAVDARIVEVEVDVASGLPATVIVGLPDVSIRESKERVRACLKHSQEFVFPLGRISVNLAPADLFKYGTHFDLAVALGMLLASGQIRFDSSQKIFFGELALSGAVRKIRGVLAFALAARSAGFKQIFVPEENAAEAALVSGIEVVAVSSLDSIAAMLQSGSVPASTVQPLQLKREKQLDFADIAGQAQAKRCIEIAAAGGHNIALSGPPGSGKTMLAQALSSILPELSGEQLLESIKLQSIVGTLSESSAAVAKPFRSPHHSITLQAFIGGGRIPVPGEISLAHNGVLFLDEFPEFPRSIIEVLRQPLECGLIRLTRVQRRYVYPADFILVTAQNPCPCGYYGDSARKCTCTVPQVLRYQKRISGPVLDRIDMQIPVARVSLDTALSGVSENSEQIAARVLRARQLQNDRQGSVLNSRLSQQQIAGYCQLSAQGLQLLKTAYEKFKFSLRAYFKILKVARTVADLAQSKEVLTEHVAEAVAYRFRDTS